MTRFALLRDPDFRRLFTAHVAVQAGTQVLALALPLIAVLALRASPLQVGVLAMCQTLAFLVIGLPAGAVVDRLRKRNVMIVAGWGRMLAVGSIPLAWWLDLLTIGQLYGVALVLGGFTVFFDVAYQSYIPHLAGRGRLVQANSALEAVHTVARLGGPSAGGYLVQLLTAPFALIATVLGFAWSALWLGQIRTAEPRLERGPRSRLGGEILEGLAFVLGHPLLRRIAGGTATLNLFTSMARPVLLMLLARELGLAAGTIGPIMAASGLGGLAGALVNAAVVRRVGHGPAIWLSIALPVPLMFALPWAQADWRLGVYVLWELVFGIGTVVFNITQLSFRQAVTPAPLLGRVNATMRFLVWGTLPMGGLLGGVLAETIGIRPTILVAASVGGLAFLWVVTSPLRTMRELS
ncbi:MFS transporter [Nonomuraea sp. B19D2]|uniref:MFS transporter n=1 Tax=Nonomuraea sp. B19D2 TaxID=3159561 RepID=UPI0032DA1D2F